LDPITRHSISRAAEEAVVLWALASAQYPERHQLILNAAQVAAVETISSFALNARRAMEVLTGQKRFRLNAPRWQWAPTVGGEIVCDLRDGLNRIIHAQALEIGFTALPKNVAVIDGGAVVVPYIRAATDRRQLAFIDPFALAHAFLYQALPVLENTQHEHIQ